MVLTAKQLTQCADLNETSGLKKVKISSIETLIRGKLILKTSTQYSIASPRYAEVQYPREESTFWDNTPLPSPKFRILE